MDDKIDTSPVLMCIVVQKQSNRFICKHLKKIKIITNITVTQRRGIHYVVNIL